MSDNINIHDNEITSYKVDLKNHKIIIYSEYQEKRIIKKTNIVFHDVLVHFFQNELAGSIILDIEQYNIKHFINDNSKLLEQRKKFCWQIDYNTIEELTEELLKEKYYYYVILSSYGLEGWILAKKYEVIVNN